MISKIIDDKDRKILEVMKNNARLKNTEIAEKTGLTVDVVKYRINRMEKHGIIQFYKTKIDPEKLGYPFFSYLLIETAGLDQKEIEEFVEYFKSLESITLIETTYGKWSFFLEAHTKDHKEFDEIVNKIKKKFSSKIKDIQIITVLDRYSERGFRS